MPWKNGGGVTTEIAVFPEGAGLDDFEWRLSVANVASDGPFSLFPGIERTLAVLEGEGIVLSIGDRPELTLTRGSAPFAFPADQPISARLIAGPILDFNVMSRRGRISHLVERVAWSADVPPAGTAVVFCASGSARISSAGEERTLRAHDAAILDARFAIEEAGGAELFRVALEPV
jgi:uncharacterized protein